MISEKEKKIECFLKENPLLCDNFEKKECFNCFWNRNSETWIKHNICFYQNIYNEALEKLVKARRKIKKWKRKLSIKRVNNKSDK